MKSLPKFRACCLAILAVAALEPASAQQVIRLWPGKAPGTEAWTEQEQVRDIPGRGRQITNVVDPTLAVFLPPPEKANGTAIIVAPGGGMRMLSYDSGGTEVAKWLNARGYAAFVLKYRIKQQRTAPAQGEKQAGPPPLAPPAAGMPMSSRPEMVIVNGNANPAQDDPEMDKVLRMAVADAQEAIKLIRHNALEWHVDPHKVGIMGFSAGGGVAVGTALGPPGEAYPDFAATLFGPSLQDVNVPQHAAPLFMAVTEYHYNVTPGLMALFGKWRDAKKPAELHIYDGVNGNLDMRPHGTPSDTWLDRLIDWLALRSFAPKVTYSNSR